MLARSVPHLDLPPMCPGKVSGSMKLTVQTIRTLALEAGATDKIWFDSDLPGFGYRVRASGVKTWVVQYAFGGKTKRMSLGSPALLDAGRAREAARDILAAVRLGRD